MTDPMDDLRQESADMSGVDALSPAAQAVLDAVREVCLSPADEIATVALRAASHQLTSAKAIGTLRHIANELEHQRTGATMMTEPNPLTPPPELVQQWINEEDGLTAGHIATQAANWGADQELEACCEWLRENIGTSFSQTVERVFRAARRPKPLSLKQQALSLLPDQPGGIAMKFTLHPDDIHTLRRALEGLPE